jgi:predicted ATPase
MQFTRIRLKNWRNFADVDVQLERRAFLVGANASGKSNFLDVFRFLHDLVATGGGFQKAILSRRGVSSIRNLAARHPDTDVAIEVELTQDEKQIWQYRIAFNQEKNGEPFLKEEVVKKNNELILKRPNEDDKKDRKRLSQTQLEQTFANLDFRDITDFFSSVRYIHIVPQLVRDADRYEAQTQDPFGSDFLEQLAQVHSRSRNANLRRIQTALSKAIPYFSDLEWHRDDRGIAHLRAKYQHWPPKGAWQNEQEFSDGTLRLIGLLWALQADDGPLLLEEPELSLHPGIVRHLPQMMYSVQRARKRALRQLIISTHSSELLNDKGIAADEVLLFRPIQRGTEIISGASNSEIKQLLQAGLTASEALERVTPENAHQLPLWS